jgi:ribonuclease PH
VSFKRADGRNPGDIRPVRISLDSYGYAHASVLYEQGNTKVLCGVTLQPGVPPFLKGQKIGWLSAEYAMLPVATHQRTQRDGTQPQRNPRSIEISRLIGRCLRPTVDLAAIGERTIVVDCDVLQADGSTRVACITAASIALQLAGKRWLQRKMFDKNVVLFQVAAVSVGMVDRVVCADLSYEEDSRCDTDFNVVLTEAGDILELQGTAEKMPLGWADFDAIKVTAQAAIKSILYQVEVQVPQQILFANPNLKPQQYSVPEKPALFSLANRFNK